MKVRNKKLLLRKIGIGLSTAALCCCLTLTAVFPSWQDASSGTAGAESSSLISQIDDSDIDSHIEDYYSASTTESLSDALSDEDEISVIVQLDAESIFSAYTSSSKIQKEYTIGEYALTNEGAALSANIYKENLKLQAAIASAGVQYTLGSSYDVLFGGFEITTKVKYFDKICKVLDGKAAVIVGEVYDTSDVEVVTNDVNVYDTGIFDSSDSEYDGSGVVIAVLDTGLDYTHSAFSVNRFEGEEVITLSTLSGTVGKLTASQRTAGLTAADVYVNEKIPFAYDYADSDSDVFPINSEHGTHVSGIIVGNDDEITGVAPNAQLAFMKVFSDSADGAKTSWILAALEDCVLLGVDVINMSLGSAAGFSREVDEENVQAIYDAIQEQGISLVVAASNSYNSTYGSEKNGNLGLTSNPDSATVGSPSTYDAALSVASISGTETPYLLSSVASDTPIYITEGSGTGAITKDFVSETLAYNNVTSGSVTLEYVVVPGIGRSADYTGLDVSGKIALVRRGNTTFEDKARIAMEKGAAACIIYNNVSGEISMSVGAVGDFPVCSISQDDGEMLAAVETGGTITISESNKSGPFMSNFSSWGPTPSLGIKPEITAHGGDIYSAVPGQSYDRLSGTSMAAPNQSGVTALIRQYVKENYPDATNREVTALVNQIMMSTTDIVYNKNGLAYSVRKQGAGLANLTKATSTPAYLRTYDGDGEVMDKTKLELGDDPDKTGVYEMTFELVNTGGSSLSYDVGAIVMTEGVSDTLTYAGLTTVTEEGYTLSGASISVKASGGSVSGTTVTVSGNNTCSVTVTITLSDSDKEYLDSSFANGMYVEGFITLDAVSGTDIDLSVCYLAFYGDWTQAPLFDLDYFETNADELDDSIDTLDKTLPDAYATTPLGGLYNDYIVYLGSYAFAQDPNATTISATREHIALSNYTTGESGTSVHSIYKIYGGMLRGAKEMVITITNTATGEVIYEQTEYNQRKSYSSGSTIYPSSIDVDFDLADYDLKNNTEYMVTVTGYLDYGDGGINTNLNNTFSFPFVVDFQAPVLTNVEFRAEYDKDSKSYKVYADMSVYDNHYTEAAYVGYIYENTDPDSGYTYSLASFGRYLTAVYSSFNSTTTVSYELTDYLDEIKNSYNGNSFIVQFYDYAMNYATYEVSIPDNITSIIFSGDRVTADEETGECTLELGLYETFSLSEIIEVLPSESWVPSLNYSSSDESVVRVVNGKLIGVAVGSAYITAASNSNPDLYGTIKVIVTDATTYDKPVAESFSLTGYYVNKVFYFSSSDDRDLGVTEAGSSVEFTSSTYSLSMYPSESVTIEYELNAYFPEDTIVEFTSGNATIATVDEDGTIIARAEGNTTISVRVLMKNSSGEYASTLYSQTISITVKDPYSVNAYYLMNYYGLGGEVEIPDDLGITEIYSYAFSNSHWVAKDENDVIDDEDPYYSKQTYIGEDTITKVIIPEGVEVIGAYAFAGLTALEEVVLPSTLTKIQYGAFYGCTALQKVTFSGANNLQFINNNAFNGCTSLTDFSFTSIIAIGDAAFAYTGLLVVNLPATAQSIGAQAFYHTNLYSITIQADKVKLGSYAFAYCTNLTSLSVNASVIPTGLLYGCSSLESVTLGADVSVISQLAFGLTEISAFTVDSGNASLYTQDGGTMIVSSDGTLVAVAPTAKTFSSSSVTSIAEGVFSGNSSLTTVSLPNVTAVSDYAFAYCTSLRSVTLGALTEIGDYAFIYTRITSIPTLADNVGTIGDYAFYGTRITGVSIPDGATVGDYAFAVCPYLVSVTIGDNVSVGTYAFGASYSASYTYVTASGSYYYYYLAYTFSTSLTSVTIGDNVSIGDYAFIGASSLTTISLGEGVSIGDYAFYACSSLSSVDLSAVVSIGDYAFSGMRWGVYYTSDNSSYTFAGYADEILTATSGNQLDLIDASKLISVDLSSCVSLGAYAFSYVPLTDVVLGEELSFVGEGAFYGCLNLTDVDLGGVTEIGSYAFCGAEALAFIDLSGVVKIGANAFNGSALTEIELAEGAEIGEKAFYQNVDLAAVENLEKAVSIGASAFAYTALTEADLSAAVTIGDFAFAYTNVTSVTLGSDLAALGENPFAGCAIGAFTNESGETTYSIGENVLVIDGVLYRVAANGGYELICYPIAVSGTVFTTADNTIRIGAQAFYGSSLISVEFNRDVAAIGDKAFYACYDLTVVIFKSIEAPVLEEEYDIEYLSEVGENGYSNLYNRAAFTGGIEFTNGTTFETLGITPYKMWNWYGNYPTYYFGANFVGLIGDETLTSKTLVMVRPNNGTGYDTFIYAQYFAVTVDGMTAISDEALAVIDLINALPSSSSVTLANEEEIMAALAAYNALPTAQQALLQGAYDGTDYYNDILSPLVSIIDYLNSQSSGGNSGGGDADEPAEETDYTGLYIGIGVLAAVVVVLAAAMLVLNAKNKKKETSEGSPEDNGEAAETGETENGGEEKTEETAEEEVAESEEQDGEENQNGEE